MGAQDSEMVINEYETAGDPKKNCVTQRPA